MMEGWKGGIMGKEKAEKNFQPLVNPSFHSSIIPIFRNSTIPIFRVSPFPFCGHYTQK
jgi:hypothetical protein